MGMGTARTATFDGLLEHLVEMDCKIGRDSCSILEPIKLV